jgi:starvation-inducible DNA-binding protein
MQMARATTATQTLPGLDEALRDRLVIELNRSLAGLTDLAAAYKQAHWNVLGMDFAQLHALFDQFADQTREYMDMVAERAVTIGGTAHGTIQAAVEQTLLPPFPVEERDQVQLLTELVERLDALTAELRHAMDAAADEAATEDVYIEVVRGLEKQRWMLQAHLVRH